MPTATGQGNGGSLIFASLEGVGMGSVNSADIPTVTALNVNVGNEMSPTFYKWLADSLNCGVPKNGSVVSTDYSRNVIFWDDWSAGQINQLVFPAVDASASTPLTLSLAMRCKNIQRRSEAPATYIGTSRARRSAFLSRNFQLSIDGLTDCRYVMSVGSITAGGKTGRKACSPDVTFTVKEMHAGSFRTWQ